MTHLAMAFAVSHPGVTSAILGPRTMEQFDDLLAVPAGIGLGVGAVRQRGAVGRTGSIAAWLRAATFVTSLRSPSG